MSEEVAILTFHLGGETYGMPISSIRLLESMVPSTAIQGSPDHLMGLANLRGQIISIVDLKSLYGIEEDYREEKDYLIVLKTMNQLMLLEEFSFNDQAEESEDILAIKVGKISGMENFPAEAIDTDIHHIQENRRQFVQGILKTRNELITIFDVTALLQYCQNTLNPSSTS